MNDNKSKELEKRVSELESELEGIKSTLYTPDKEKIYNAKFNLSKFNLINNPLRFDKLMDPIQIRIKPDKLIKFKYPEDRQIAFIKSKYPEDLLQMAFILDTLSTGKLLARLVGGDDRQSIPLSSLCRIYIAIDTGYLCPNIYNFNLHFEGDGIYRTETKVDRHINMLVHDENKFKKICSCLNNRIWNYFYWNDDEINYVETMDKYVFDSKHLVDKCGDDLWIDVTIGYNQRKGGINYDF